MSHAELVNWICGVHVVIFVSALAYYFKTVDNKLHEISLERSSETKKRLKQKIFTELSIALLPAFTNPKDEVIKVLTIFGPDGEAWEEEQTDTVETENYRNALSNFASPNTIVLVDMCNLMQFCNRCVYWSCYLNKMILALIIFQVVAIGLSFIEKLGIYRYLEGVILSTLFISLFIIIIGLLALPFLNYYHADSTHKCNK